MITVRAATAADVPALRRLVNDAYRALADMGLNYTGTYQDDEITRARMRGGDTYLLVDGATLVGTVTVRARTLEDGDRHASVNQLAVSPSRQRCGLGTRLMEIAEGRARELGLGRVRLDTAIPARHLIAWYAARGYVKVGEVQHDGKTYRSVVLEKRLG